MFKKKKVPEELMKTHVLNLNEIRDAEQKDKHERRKKIPTYFFVIGIILIITGVSISFVIAYKASHKPKQIYNEKKKDKLICTSNLKDDYYLVDIHSEFSFIFKNNKLSSLSANSISKPYGKQNNILTLQNDIHTNSYNIDSYNDIENGITYNLIIINSKELKIEYEINYDKYVINNNQNVINSYTKLPNLTNKDSYETVKEKTESIGFLCN